MVLWTWGPRIFLGQMRCLPIVKWTIPADFERASPSRYAVLSLQCQAEQMHPSPNDITIGWIMRGPCDVSRNTGDIRL